MPEIYNMRVIPKRASVCGLHADAVAAHPSLYRGMHFASCSCREGEVSNNDRESNNHRVESWWNNAVAGQLGSGLIFIPVKRTAIAEQCISHPKYIRERIRSLTGSKENSFLICHYIHRSTINKKLTITNKFELRSSFQCNSGLIVDFAYQRERRSESRLIIFEIISMN